jgi:TRAP-type C4-dicarboxylate transport system permease small subunit
MAHWLSRIDDSVEKIERFSVLFFLTVMSGVVFLDVVHRVASSPGGFVEGAVARVVPAGPAVAIVTGLVFRGAGWLFCYGALRSRRDLALSGGRAALVAVGGTLGLEASVRGLLAVFPNGLVWSQNLALSLLLWVALLGATLATKARAHITLELADKLWKGARRRYVHLASGLVAATSCACLALLAAHYTADFVDQWRMGVGYVSGLPIPRWVVYSAMPACFTLMAARFAAYTVGDFRKPVAAPEEGAR